MTLRIGLPRMFLCVLLALCAGPVRAAAEPISAFAQQWLVQQYALPGNRVEATAVPVDARLGLAGHQRVDTHHLAVQVHQRAARVAGVNRRVCLDHVEEKWPLPAIRTAWLLDGAI